MCYNSGVMKIRYQSNEVETPAATLGALLDEKGAKGAVVELNGEVLPPGEGLERLLAEGDDVSVFRIVGGG